MSGRRQRWKGLYVLPVTEDRDDTGVRAGLEDTDKEPQDIHHLDILRGGHQCYRTDISTSYDGLPPILTGHETPGHLVGGQPPVRLDLCEDDLTWKEEDGVSYTVVNVEEVEFVVVHLHLLGENWHQRWLPTK